MNDLTRWMIWTSVWRDASAVLLRSAGHGQDEYPFCLEIDAEYRLHSQAELDIAITAAPGRTFRPMRAMRAGPARAEAVMSRHSSRGNWRRSVGWRRSSRRRRG